MKRITFLFLFVIGSNLSAQGFSLERNLSIGMGSSVQAYKDFPWGRNLFLNMDLQGTLYFPSPFFLSTIITSGIALPGESSSPILYRRNIHLGLSPLLGLNLFTHEKTTWRLLLGPEFRTWLYYQEQFFTHGWGFRTELQVLNHPDISEKTLLLSFPVYFQIRGDGSWNLGAGISLGLGREMRI